MTKCASICSISRNFVFLSKPKEKLKTVNNTLTEKERQSRSNVAACFWGSWSGVRT